MSRTFKSTMSVKSDDRTEGSLKHSISMEMDRDVKDQSRKYPSIKDYYIANAPRKDKPIQLQNGLSNFSALQLGDDRISVGESILSESYRLPVEEVVAISAPSRDKSFAARKRDYEEATKKVGVTEIDRLERVMKDKLFQRSYETSSPFQVRKAFKFFDRDVTMRISIEGFTKALEFLGFQFSELQNEALFARYDPDVVGDIDYMHFISSAMFYAAVEPTFVHYAKKVVDTTPKEVAVDEVAQRDARLLLEAEIRRIFNKVDRNKTGTCAYDDFELLLSSLGRYLTSKEIDIVLADLGIKPGGSCSFEVFSDWWTSDVLGLKTMRR